MKILKITEHINSDDENLKDVYGRNIKIGQNVIVTNTESDSHITWNTLSFGKVEKMTDKQVNVRLIDDRKRVISKYAANRFIIIVNLSEADINFFETFNIAKKYNL